MASDYEDIEKIVPFAAGLFVGGLIGATTALLFAPQSGQRTRRKIRHKAEDLSDRAEESVRHAAEDARRVAGDAKRAAERSSERIRDNVERGVERGKEKLHL